MAYAHSGPNPDPRTWQPLEKHLRAVAELARSFAAPWGAGELAYLAGLWHDLGKYHPEFQRMLVEVQRGEPKRRVDHSSAGAIHARRFFQDLLVALPGSASLESLEFLLTATIAGHHAGLPETREALTARLEDHGGLYEQLQNQGIPREVLRPSFPPAPARVLEANGREGLLRCEFLVRMLFSAIVDADRLDTAEDAALGPLEEHPPSALCAEYVSVASLREAIDHAIDRKVADLDPTQMAPLAAGVFRYRQVVLAACRSAAAWDPGMFALDVATGGGKTLASLSFALRHAECHGKQRVIVVIPYTSIIEQTARAYRKALGGRLASNLIEHHSAVDGGDGEGGQDPGSIRTRLATENWDAPLIVTTGVQFFESLFARSASRCRKLHNIANSVVVLDEAQTLPPGLLNPTVWALNELVEGYGASVVLSTATQPALEPPFPAVHNLRRIIDDRAERPAARVRVEVMGEEAIAWSQLAAELAKPANARALCITHRRDDARELACALDQALGTEDAIHLSAGMCAAHRAACIAEIRHRLDTSAPCRVVSTQLVEAGVDLDFPVVYRAMGGLDSLVQAAGRANREGKLGVSGGVLRLYRALTPPPAGLPRVGASVTEMLMHSAEMDGEELDLFDPAVARSFFRLYYDNVGDKDSGVTPMREDFRFADIESTYRFIADGGVTLFIPLNDEAVAAIREAREAPLPGKAMRRLQRFSLAVYPGQLRRLQAAGAVEPLLPREDASSSLMFVLTRFALYDDRFGLGLSNMEQLGPDEFMQ